MRDDTKLQKLAQERELPIFPVWPQRIDLLSVGTSYREVTFSQLKESFQLTIECSNSKAVSRRISCLLLEVLKERPDGDLVGYRGGFYLDWQEMYCTALTP